VKLRRNPIERLGLDNNFHMENQMKKSKRKITNYEKAKRAKYRGKPHRVTIGDLVLDSLLKQQLARS